MRSQKHGKRISARAEVLNVSPNGLWLLAGEHEYFLSYKDFPWFTKATVSEIYNLEVSKSGNLHWPDLDVDLEIESLDSPEKYPLVYK